MMLEIMIDRLVLKLGVRSLNDIPPEGRESLRIKAFLDRRFDTEIDMAEALEFLDMVSALANDGAFEIRPNVLRTISETLKQRADAVIEEMIADSVFEHEAA